MPASQKSETRYRSFLKPKYLPVWFGIGVMRLIALLPYPAIQALGTLIGLAFHSLKGHRYQVTKANIETAFPELSSKEQFKLIKDTFVANAKGMVETTMAWWWPKERLTKRFDVYGLEHLKEAESKGKGVLLLGGHFSLMDLGGPMINSVLDFSYMYRPHDNPLFDCLIESSRAKYSHAKFNKYQTKQLIRHIKKGKTVWYGYDQDFGSKMSVFANFFSVPCATLKMPMLIAKATQCEVLMVAQFREPNGRYSLRFSKVFEGFTQLPDESAAQKMNDQLESFIRIYPDQYLWLHRRYRTRPKGELPIYPRK